MLLGNSRWKNPCKYLRASPYILSIGMPWRAVDASKQSLQSAIDVLLAMKTPA
jgi:hypothetical protein